MPRNQIQQSRKPLQLVHAFLHLQESLLGILFTMWLVQTDRLYLVGFSPVCVEQQSGKRWSSSRVCIPFPGAAAPTLTQLPPVDPRPLPPRVHIRNISAKDFVKHVIRQSFFQQSCGYPACVDYSIRFVLFYESFILCELDDQAVEDNRFCPPFTRNNLKLSCTQARGEQQ